MREEDRLFCKDCKHVTTEIKKVPQGSVLEMLKKDAPTYTAYICTFNPVWIEVTADHYCGRGKW
jgi:hypothetical protein